VTEVPGESTLRKNFQQLQEGEGRRTPNPLYHAQPAFFPADNAAKPNSKQPAAAPRGGQPVAQPRPHQQQNRHHHQVTQEFSLPIAYVKCGFVWHILVKKTSNALNTLVLRK